MTDKLLIPASRQYMHNDGSGLLCGYDKKITDEVVSKLKLKTEQLEFILKMCINDLYSSSGKFKKTTARVIYKYVNDNNIDI